MDKSNRQYALVWQDVERARSILAGCGKHRLSPRSIPVRVFCILLCSDLMRLRAEGWSWSDLSRVLRKNGIGVSKEQLSRYLNGSPCDASALPGLVETYIGQGDKVFEKALAVLKKPELVACLSALLPDSTRQRISSSKKHKLRRDLAEYIRRLAAQDWAHTAEFPEQPSEGGEHRQQFNIDLGIGGED